MKKLFYWIMLLTVTTGVSSPADTYQEKVQQHLEEFNAAWPSIPLDERQFGIRRILSYLNLDYPGLEQVRDAVSANDFERAEQELLRYYCKAWADRAEPVEKLYPDPERHSADAMRHHFRGNKDVYPPVWRGENIDWSGRAFVDGKEIQDAEWYYQFQRLTWWPALASAYAVTGDEKYFFEWRYELFDWAQDNLPITAETPYFVKRGMETFYRCERWTETFPYFLRSAFFDSKTLLVFLGSFYEQAEHLRTVYSETGNHLLGQLSRAFLNGINFPEFKKSGEWIDDALVRLPDMMFSDTYADGMNKELVFSYHTMYIDLFAQAYTLFREHGYENRIPAAYYERLLKMAEIYALQSFPDNTICQFGDAWKHRFPGTVFRNCLAPFKEDIPYFDYMVSGGVAGSPPSRCSVAYPESGFYFFRSAWSPEAVFMPIKCTEPGAYHSQIDNGTFELFAYGRNFMNDSGCYVYNSDSREDKKLRNWFRSTVAHQTLTLDKRDVSMKPKYLFWKEGDGFIALAFENQSYPNLKHRRTVLFIDNKYFLIHDEADGSAAGPVRVHFQLVPCAVEQTETTMKTCFETGPNLLVKTFPQDLPVVMEEEEGWISYQQKEKEARPAWSWRVDKSVENSKVQFLTALIPQQKGGVPLDVEARVQNSEGRCIYWLKVDGQEYQIELDASGNGN